MSTSQTIFTCPLCTEFRATDFQLLLPHIRLVHSTRPGFSLQCSIENCTRFFTNMKTYANHIYCDHLSLPKTASAYRCANTVEGQDHEDGSEGSEGQEESGLDDEHHPDVLSDFQSIAARWILKIKEGCKLTQATMEEVVQGVTDLNQYILSQVFMAVKAALTEVGQDANNIPQLHEIFDPNGNFGRSFRGVETSYQLLKYCKDNLGFVVSVECLQNVLILYT